MAETAVAAPGIDRRRVWGWMMFDWASQPFYTLLLTFIFGPHFTSAVVGNSVVGQEQWGWMLSAAGLTVAFLAPVLGAIADTSGRRRPWIWGFSILYVVCAWVLWYAEPGMADYGPILIAFALALIAVEFATIFTNAMLPDLGPREEVGRISGSGWALGYVGGVLALAIMVALFAENGDSGRTMLGIPPVLGLDPAMREGTRAVGPLSAIWYAVFMIPFFLWVPDRNVRRAPKGAVRRALAELGRTIRGLPRHPSLLAYLASSMFYRDALAGVFAFGGIYAKGVLGWSITAVAIFGIMAAITGAIFAWIGGHADKAFGPGPVIRVCIWVLTLTALAIVTISRDSVLFVPVDAASSLPDLAFYVCGGIVGAAGGALQAASRTMMVHQANPERVTEAFGLYALAGKATTWMAPASIAAVTHMTESQPLGVLPVAVLFLIGLVLLRFVDPRGWEAQEA